MVMGVSESVEEAISVGRQYKEKKAVEDGLQKAIAYNVDKYSSLILETPDAKVNHIMKEWIKKQVDCCIVGKKGVR